MPRTRRADRSGWARRGAIEEVNKDGGYNGRPFRLVPKWSDSPWTAGGRMVVEMAYNDRVWAIVGSIDGVATHVAEQVITKALLPLIDPGSTDRTVNAAMVPWMFSCLPGRPTDCGGAGAASGGGGGR
jgi:branched-chain amino acid transport system substrate-binding protein